MAAIDFPNSPAANDIFTSAGKSWVYSGYAWTLIGVSTQMASAVLSTVALDGGNAATIQFNVMSAVDAGGA